jgi:phosphoglycolate phosphatase
MLLKILDALKVSRDRAVLIGDSTNDITGGHNAGIKVCAVGYGMGNREKMAACNPDWFIEKPEDLIGLFA